MQIKRTLAFGDDVAIEAGQTVNPPLRKVAVVAIIDNPFAGKFEKDLSPLTKASEEIGRHISNMAIALLAPHKPESYGKGAVIGTNGEQEHGVAMLTTVFGNVMRDAAGGGKAWISSLTKRAAPGASITSRSRTRMRSMCVRTMTALRSPYPTRLCRTKSH